MRLLINGGCGFLGANLAAAGLERGAAVTVFDSLYRQGAAANLDWLRARGLESFVYGDIRNAHDVAETVRSVRPDVIFHLAGQVAMTTSMRNPRLDFEINAVGTYNVLEAARQHAPGAAVLFSSSNKVYGDLEQYTYAETATRYQCVERPNGFDESTPLDFRTPYGCSKGAADQYMLDYSRWFGLRTVVFRHSSMYGGRQFATTDQGWIGWFCRKAIEASRGEAGEPFTIAGNGKQVRDVLHAEDIVRLYFAAAERADELKGEAFNVGGGMPNSLSLLELFALLEEQTGAKLAYRVLPPRESDQRVFVADNGKVQHRVGWTPRVGAREGVARMLEWVSSLE